ncbi:MAG: hypothetical protein B7C54_00285 [Acidimicrobiales bacterium mtb01]|nr:nuclear transport factor 2 family protein [Actinomycetota bacterium]TEX48709.1 MAG: hypothetical protein B7C54_00285 [Acidimicrobiales bacterium mtb01]
MTAPIPALQIAIEYFDAWRDHRHDDAMKVVADDVVSETPFGPIHGADALRDSEAQFAPMLQGATLVASYGDDTTALLLYYTHTHPAPNVLSAKCFEITGGKITAIKALFDTGAFANANA